MPGFEPDPNAIPEPIQIGRRTLNGALKRAGGGRWPWRQPSGTWEIAR